MPPALPASPPTAKRSRHPLRRRGLLPPLGDGVEDAGEGTRPAGPGMIPETGLGSPLNQPSTELSGYLSYKQVGPSAT